MTFRPILPLLALVLTLGCAPREPSFVYEAAPGAALDSLATVALDPRQQVWKLDGQYSADPWEYREPVLAELRAKGFRFVPSAQAELWLDLVAFRPSRNAAPDTRMNHGGRAGMDNGPKEKEVVRQPSSGPVTLIVRLLSSRDEQVLWYGSMELPDMKPGPGTPLPEDLVRRLLQPLPARPVASGKPDAGVAN